MKTNMFRLSENALLSEFKVLPRNQRMRSTPVQLYLQRFVGPEVQPKHVYTDGSGELSNACKDLGRYHDTSTPHRPQTNGVAELAVRRVKEGTSCFLSQIGWGRKWWPYGVDCYCSLRCIYDIISNAGSRQT